MVAQNVNSCFALLGLINGILLIIFGIIFIVYGINGKEWVDIGIGIIMIILGICLLLYEFSK